MTKVKQAWAYIKSSKAGKYAPWAIMVVVCVAVVLVAMNIAERTDTERNAAYERYADSMATVRHSDSVAFSEKVYELTVNLNAALAERDSIERKASTTSSKTKVMYRTVYKDSVREVTVENDQTASIYEERISHVRDSMANIIAQQDDVEIKYVDREIHDTIVRYVEKTDSVTSVRTEEKKDGPIGLYASGKVGYGTDGLRYGADAGMKYFIWGPLYGKAGVEYDGAVSGVAGIGLDIRF